jgi:hypothetical protein
MSTQYPKSLSNEERLQLAPTLDKVDSALDELSSQLERLGRPVGEDAEGTSRCLVPGCTCQHFLAGRVPLTCKTPRCGHRFTRHDVF